MVRKMVLVVLATAVVLGSMATIASAAQNVANTNQKGSLLIWPKIENFPDPDPSESTDTYITIASDYYSEVWVKCYWVDENQTIQDFMFRLTPNQPVWFRASDGRGDVMTVPPFMGDRGELKCWAVDAAGAGQIAFNHLYGNALIIYGQVSGLEYSAWSFTARGLVQGAAVGTGGNLRLTGANGGYDACPQYLVENFIADVFNEGSEFGEQRWPGLALVPCKQDLRQDRVPTCTKAKFDVWNENETKYTGAYRCLKCWFEGYLAEIGYYYADKSYGFGGDKFILADLHTYLARFRVTGVASTVCNNKFKTPDTVYGPGVDKCKGGQVNSPLLGVLWHYIYFANAENDGMMVGTTPHTAGADGTGFVLWDPQGEPPQALNR
jgi:hypothetical protein